MFENQYVILLQIAYFLKKWLIDGVILNHPVNMNDKALTINTFLYHEVDNSEKKIQALQIENYVNL